MRKNISTLSKNYFPRFTKVLSVLPLSLLILGGWWTVYDYGTYIHVEGNLIRYIPLGEDPVNIIIDSSVKGKIDIIIEKNPLQDHSSFTTKGELPEFVTIYREQNQLIVEGPLPKDTVIHMAWTPWYEVSYAIHVATDDTIRFFGGHGKLLMKELHSSLLYLSIAVFIFELFGHRYNKKHQKPTVLNFYKIHIVQIKQEIQIIFKNMSK